MRKSFVTGQTWNPSLWSDPPFDKKMEEVYPHPRRSEAPADAPGNDGRDARPGAVPLAADALHLYTAWWPWVQNYDGELRAGACRPGPIYARIWIDQEMKKKMGF